MRELKVEIFSVLLLFALAFFLPQTFIGADASAGTADVTLNVAARLSFSLSSHNLTISNLAPGTVASSNVITITTNTNNATGYTLAATVGDASHNTTSLIRSSTTDAFEGLTTNSSLAMNDIPDSKWGFSSNSGLTFSGLPLYTSTPKIIDISSLPVDGGTIDFSIAAHAPTEISAGTYENVITFSVVANYDTLTLSDAYAIAGRTPVSTASGSYYTMQDMSMDICNNVDTLNSSLQLLDTRDNKLYWVTKLADGNCWMTQNLDYDIMDSGNILATLDGQTTTGIGNPTLVSANTTISCDRLQYKITGTVTCSYDPGDYYAANGTSTSNSEISCNSSVNDGENCHYHLGNYYQENAVVKDYNLRPSICPQHWKVPTASMSNALSSLLGTNIATFAPTYFNFSGKIDFTSNGLPVNERGSSGQLMLDRFFKTSIDSTYGLRQLPEGLSIASMSYDGYSVRCVAFSPVQTTTLTLSFDLQGGNGTNTDYFAPVAITVEEGGGARFVFTKPVPTKNNKKFTGWEETNTEIYYEYKYPNTSIGGGGIDFTATPAISLDPYFVTPDIIFYEDTTLKAVWGNCNSGEICGVDS